MCIWCYLFFNSWTEIMLWDIFSPQMAGDVFCNHFSFHEFSSVGLSIIIFDVNKFCEILTWLTALKFDSKSSEKGHILSRKVVFPSSFFRFFSLEKNHGSTCWSQKAALTLLEFKFLPRHLEDHPRTCMWLITMVSFCPLSRVVSLPNGLNGL